MRYVIVGAGAIGGVLAARLAEHSVGHPPVIVARGENARAIRASGMRLRSPDDETHTPIEVVSAPSEIDLRDDDVLVFATKTQQVQAALLDWVDEPVHDASGAVVSTAGQALPVFMALNGVESERLALRLFARVFGVCVWLPSARLGPGDFIVHIAPVSGAFIIGRYASTATDADRELLHSLRADWEGSSFQVHLVDDVMRWKYSKLVLNLGNGVQALVGPSADADGLVHALHDEARSVLERAGIPMAGADEERALRGDIFRSRPIAGVEADLGGSSWQSMARGEGTIETDYLNGEIVLVAREHGTNAPLNAAVQEAARQAAVQRRPAGSLTVDDLRALLPHPTSHTK